MATYPASVKSFSTKVSNDKIEAAHVNDLQDEVTAVEGGLINGFVHDLKFTDATYDIGKSGATRPRDGFFSRDVVIGGTLNVAGNVVSDLKFTDATYDIGKTGATRPRDGFFSRNVEIGGTINIAGNVVSDLKFTDATYDIGKSGATRPRDGFFSRNFVIGGTLGVTGATTLNSTLGVTGATTLNSTLDVTGIATFSVRDVHNNGIDISPPLGGRIIFPATQNASSSANTLDDYAEGSWTPVIGGSGGTSGQTYTVQVGTYIKVGRLVTVNFNVTLSAKGTITTDVQIQGLPFTIENTANYAPALMIPYWANVAVAKVFIGGYGILNTTAATVTGIAAASGTHTILATADIGNTTQFVGTFVYRATA